MKIIRIACVCAVLVALASSAYCVDVYPTVDFAFNSDTFEYSWTVNYTADVNVNFSTFHVEAGLLPGSWTSVSGAWSGSPAVNEAWTFTSPPIGDGTVALRWQGGSAHQRLVGSGEWTGVFKITVPNSQPVVGDVALFASAIKYQLQSSYVPQVVPEPSSILALGSMAGLIPFVIRRKRK